MMRRVGLVGIALAACVVLFSGTSRRPVGLDVPAQLADEAFWRLSHETSEPDGYFDSDNLVSNEDTFETVIPELRRIVPPGRVYLGVGPDQNFTYIAAIEPRLAFILDVRRGNLQVHLMYKALFELSADRAEFLSRLFARPVPHGVESGWSAGQLLSAFAGLPPDQPLQREGFRAIVSRLQSHHHFPLAPDDVSGIGRVYNQFVSGGPELRFVSSRSGNWYPSFQDIQISTDANGVAWSYLSSEAHFQRVKTLQEANAIIPIVGNFAGPSALKAIGRYLAAHGATVGAFYTSNVERYLFQDRLWQSYVDNVSELPLTEASTFIRSCFDACSSLGQPRAVSLLDSMPTLLQDVKAGHVATYGDVLLRTRRR